MKEQKLTGIWTSWTSLPALFKKRTHPSSWGLLHARYLCQNEGPKEILRLPVERPSSPCAELL